MKKQLFEAQQRMELSIARVDKVFGLSEWWDLEHHFIEGHDGDDKLDSEGLVSVYKTCATTTAQWAYRVAVFRWYLPTVCRITDDELDWVVIHEFVHVLNSPMSHLIPAKDQNAKLEEASTENLARVIRRAMGAGGPV